MSDTDTDTDTTSRNRAPGVDTQRAFVGLLARPLVTSTSDPELHRQVARNAQGVSDAARRLGYRLAGVGRAFRLVRPPIAGAVAMPPPPLAVPSRRVLALSCVLAAVCEDTSGGATLAKLSELVGQLTAGDTSPVTAYDQRLQAHRRHLLRAVEVLEHWGVLRRRTRDDRMLEDWADAGSGIGAGYDIDRDALLLMTSPDILAHALDPRPVEVEHLRETRGRRALRALVETPVVLYRDLPPDDAEALRATRGLRAADVEALTGGQVEARAEGLLLLLPDEPPSPGTVDWPRATVAAWVALLMADAGGRTGRRQVDGTVELNADEVDELAEALHRQRTTYLNKVLREDPAKIRPTAEAQLRHLGLLRLRADGGWLLLPVAGRFRDPEILLRSTSTNDDTLGWDEEEPT